MATSPTDKGQMVEVSGTDIEGFPLSYLKQVIWGYGYSFRLVQLSPAGAIYSQ